MQFLPIRADLKNNFFENIRYLSFVIELLFKNRRLLIDDYYPKDDGKLLDFLIEEINAAYPWFVVGVMNGEPVGAAWFSHWHFPHSCQLHACIDKKFWGKTSLLAVEELLKFLVKNTRIKRVQMEIPEFNVRAVNFAKRAGFEEEGLIRCATLKDGKPLNHILLGRIL